MFLATGSPTEWAVFSALVVILLVLDLGVFHRKAHRVTAREALAWSIVWIGVALAFNAYVWATDGKQAGLEFLAGYLIEKSLSVDNLFVFLVIFSYFRVEPKYQHRVLFWGILGAIVTRGAFILLGVALITRFHFVVYVLGAFLVWTGGKIVARRETEVHPERNPVVRVARRMLPLTDGFRGQRFFVREDGQVKATFMFLVLLVVEATDVVFAIDSVPAVLAVTTDTFLVFTSNLFAILGLRALFFLLADMAVRFRYLKVGVGLVLVFVGLKMLASRWYEPPIEASLAVIGVLLAGSVGASLLAGPAQAADE